MSMNYKIIVVSLIIFISLIASWWKPIYFLFALSAALYAFFTEKESATKDDMNSVKSALVQKDIDDLKKKMSFVLIKLGMK